MKTAFHILLVLLALLVVVNGVLATSIPPTIPADSVSGDIVVSSDGMSISFCPVGCVCGDDTIKCPRDVPPDESDTISCPIGCTCTNDIVSCPAEPMPFPGDEGKACPVGCTCTEETVTCPAIPVPTNESTQSCPVGCTCTEDIVSCPAQPTPEPIPTPVPLPACPVGCVCTEDTVTCPAGPTSPPTPSDSELPEGEAVPTNAVDLSDCQKEGYTYVCPTSAPIALILNGKAVAISGSPDGTAIRSDTYEATTQEKIIISGDSLYVGVKEDSNKLVLSPSDAVSKAIVAISIPSWYQEKTDVTLTVTDEEPLYTVVQSARVTILGIFPTSYTAQATVSGQSGEIVNLEEPWWGFLVLGP